MFVSRQPLTSKLLGRGRVSGGFEGITVLGCCPSQCSHLIKYTKTRDICVRAEGALEGPWLLKQLQNPA